MEIRFAQPEDLQQIAQLYISNHKRHIAGCWLMNTWKG